MSRRIEIGLVTAILTLGAANADARQITLAWDASSESAAGCVLFYGTESRDVAAYPYSVDVGNLLSVQLDLPAA